jgi:hypothetical protein
VKPTADRGEAPFERLVERELGRGTGLPGDACPQVELLAAWFDRSLPPSEEGQPGEAADIEAHLASCARCQAVVADLARSEPPTLYVHPRAIGETSVRPWTWHLRWLAPLAAAASVVAAVVLQTKPASAPSATPPSAVGQSARALPSESLPQATVPPVEREKAQPAAQEGAASEKQAKNATLPRVDKAPTRTLASVLRGPVPPAAPPQPSAAPPAPSADAGPVAPSTPPPAAAREADQVVAESAAPAAKPVASKQRADTAGQPMTFATATAFSTLSAFAPDGRAGWKYQGAGVIKRTTDSGASWTDQALPAGVRLSLLSAASERVCWAAGPGGVLARTIDGLNWHLVTGPSQATIVGLVASGGTSARVRTADGLTYETHDGGVTWQQR